MNRSRDARDPSGEGREGLAAQIDALFERKFRQTFAQMQGVEADLKVHARQVSALLRHTGLVIADAPPTERPVPDRSWDCAKCGARLGYYDEAKDVLRIRHKDGGPWHFHAGPGSWVTATCRDCGEHNVVSASSVDGDKIVSEAGVIVLDLDTLLMLLARAHDAPTGEVCLQVVEHEPTGPGSLGDGGAFGPPVGQGNDDSEPEQGS